jgi:hypothetical protein
MNLVLHLTPETEAKLKERAAASGKAPERLALEALEEILVSQPESGELLSKESRLAKFRELIASMPDGSPDADLSREAAYGNRGQ